MKRQAQREEFSVVELPQDVWNIIFQESDNDFRFRCLSISKEFYTLILGTIRYLYLVNNFAPRWSAPLSRKCCNLEKLSVISCIGSYKGLTDDWILPLTNLNTLRIPNNTTLTDASLETLTSLRTLVLENACHITDSSLQNLTNLTYLDLSRNSKITNSAVSKLVNLRTLILDGNQKITDQAVSCLTSLTRISLCDNYLIS